MSPRALEHQESRTAAYTCFSRACASMERHERFRGPDRMARIFLPPAARWVSGIGFLRRLFFGRLAAPGIYEYVLARTKLLDEVFLGALEESFPFVVLLGAGYDTRALRFRERNGGTGVLELDAPATQRAKLEVLRRKGVVLPDELVFVPTDFNRQPLSETLLGAGYRPGERTLFLWEGVTMYLTSEAVDGTLAFIRNSAGRGSLVAFDYVYASVLRGENRFYGEEGIRRRVSKVGEGWTFGIEEGQVEAFLHERGFEVVSHHTAADLEKRYLTAEDGTLFGRINGTHAIVAARHA